MKELRHPVARNKRDIPVIIYGGNEELIECKDIQEAGKWLQKHTGDRFKRFSKISNGIWHGDTWSYNGVTYSFTTDKELRQTKLK